MKLVKTSLDDLLILKTDCFQDNRGLFQKTFNCDFFKENNLATDFKEFYYSISKKNIIRGMHFQTPPFDHVKIVYVSFGSILDVVVDLRKNSPTVGEVFSIKLDNISGDYLYIPKGFAHGFKALTDDTVVNYAQTSCYSKDNDCGVLYSSIGFDWQEDNPVISDRDLSFPDLKTFSERSPF